MKQSELEPGLALALELIDNRVKRLKLEHDKTSTVPGPVFNQIGRGLIELRAIAKDIRNHYNKATGKREWCTEWVGDRSFRSTVMCRHYSTPVGARIVGQEIHIFRYGKLVATWQGPVERDAPQLEADAESLLAIMEAR